MKGCLQGCTPGCVAGEEGDEEQKRMERMQRNRESAMLSRQRKKMQLDELEQQNKQLQATNTHLSGAPYPDTVPLKRLQLPHLWHTICAISTEHADLCWLRAHTWLVLEQAQTQ